MVWLWLGVLLLHLRWQLLLLPLLQLLLLVSSWQQLNAVRCQLMLQDKRALVPRRVVSHVAGDHVLRVRQLLVPQVAPESLQKAGCTGLYTGSKRS